MDWWLIGAVAPILAAGLATMYSFTGENTAALHQLIWIAASAAAFTVLSRTDVRFLRLSSVSAVLFSGSVILLGMLFVAGRISHGAESWLSLGPLSFQPSDLAKVALIVVLAKYFSRRHVEIHDVRHIAVSGVYAFVLFILVLVHPDLGSALLIAAIWLGMIMVSGISKKHLFLVLAASALAAAAMWNFGFKDYQKARLTNFLYPAENLRSTGYNAYQSVVAIGSGEILGKGLGYGTQSRLKFLPEYQTDFVFAAFAEEWGFVGVVILIGLYGVIVWRVLLNAARGATNFEILFGAGVAVFFMAHIAVNIGMNMHLLPVTGTPLPFMSYGGTHLMTESVLLGLVAAQRRFARPAHAAVAKNEFVGPR